jgi:hypothetical protein
MTRDRDNERLEALIDAFERSVLEASDGEVLATGDGVEAAAVASRVLKARNYQVDGSRSVAPRARLRRAANVLRVRSRGGAYDVTNVRAQFSSFLDNSALENDGDDPDLA